MALQSEPYSNITQLLGMHKSSITNWKQRFEVQGLEGIKLAYKGAKSYLTSAQRTEVITWLKTKNYGNLEELINHLDEQYGVIYQSKQSYALNWKVVEVRQQLFCSRWHRTASWQPRIRILSACLLHRPNHSRRNSTTAATARG
jgi:hypothetical protein